MDAADSGRVPTHPRGDPFPASAHSPPRSGSRVGNGPCVIAPARHLQGDHARSLRTGSPSAWPSGRGLRGSRPLRKMRLPKRGFASQIGVRVSRRTVPPVLGLDWPVDVCRAAQRVSQGRDEADGADPSASSNGFQAVAAWGNNRRIGDCLIVPSFREGLELRVPGWMSGLGNTALARQASPRAHSRRPSPRLNSKAHHLKGRPLAVLRRRQWPATATRGLGGKKSPS